jgi:hypothetical protein
MIAGEQFPIHTGLLIKAFQTGKRNQLDQILIALLVFTEQDQVVTSAVQPVLPIVTGTPCHIDLTAQNRLDSGFFGSLIKRHHAIHHAVVSQSDRSLSHCPDLFDQFRNPAGTVQQAVFAVDVEMYKSIFRHLRHVFSTPLQKRRFSESGG